MASITWSKAFEAYLNPLQAIAVDEGPVILPVPEHIVKVENEPERVAKRVN